MHRIQSTIDDMIKVFGGDRLAILCKEITKMHESFIGESLTDIYNFTKNEKSKIKGEFTIIVQGGSNKTDNKDHLDFILKLLMSDLSLRRSVEIATLVTNFSKSTIYDLSLIHI